MFANIVLSIKIVIVIIVIVVILVDNGQRHWLPDEEDDSDAKWK